MANLCYELKKQLENNFSMPFDVTALNDDGETRYVCSPSNDEQIYFEVTVYIHNKIRLLVEIHPQKHGGYILNEMAHASTEKQQRFFDYKQMLIDFGAKVKFLVNNKDLNQADEWPVVWKSFSSKITKVPIPDIEDNDFNVLLEWTRHGIDLIFTLLTITESNDIPDNVIQTEGTPQEIRSIRYERNPINRQLCLHKKGYTCAVCGMNFQDMYGDIGKNFIEVHHTTPVSLMGKDFVLDIDRDLVPLCSNCHSMIHRKTPPYQVSELRSFIEDLNYGASSMVADSVLEYNKIEINDFIIGVVKKDRVQPFYNGTAKTYYFGKKFPSAYNLKDIKYFGPYYDGGVRGYYDVNGIRTAKKSEIIGAVMSDDDNDIRIVLDLGEYHVLSSTPIKMKLVHYNYACLPLSQFKEKRL